MKIALIVESTADEAVDFVRRVQDAILCTRGVRNVELLEAGAPDPRTLTTSDSRRYRYTGTVSDTGVRECYDVRTGRRGLMGDCGFEAGGFVTSDGRVEWERPQDNPLQGWRP